MKPGLTLATFLVTALSAVAALAGEPAITTGAPGTADDRIITLSQLDAEDQTEITTTTIWTDGEVVFSGVPLARVLSMAGLSGAPDATLHITALNDYAVEMPLGEVGETFPIIATRMNGEPMSVRDKGPFWVIYPYDLGPEYQTETIYARSVWQLKALSLTD